MIKLDAKLILTLRQERAWSQEELADASGLHLRTIQRIEKSGNASLQSNKSLASAFDLDPHDLRDKGKTMSPCPECGSEKVYRSDKTVDTTMASGELLPHLASGAFSSAQVTPVVCGSCGFVRFFADDKARAKLESSNGWSLV